MIIKLCELSNPSLALAVSRQMGGKSELLQHYKDVVNHGADSGFNGFIYYSETVKFWRNNKKLILESLSQLADDLGENVINMVRNFNCIKGDFSTDEIGKALYGSYREEFDLIYNCLAWYALETVCQEMEALS
ncbi:DUF7222 domain-containing protein [Synechocystis salina]|uniref:DUF7222 domain-containing protein n=1 Tax=Synechocystis salina LEGE 00031 TaxID=1828736 RepID=A0ABR9VR77_9SYNC|nr:hypothetical protein [Synechocystis salina]MBE9242876.1 hypothetical protein [Synechocystis salina LEGE 00041]MBE9253844.1 hypothetical protein [Synechocystis salina LEGE 00031]